MKKAKKVARRLPARGAKRKGPKKVIRLKDLKPGMNVVGNGARVPKEMKLAFSMYLARGKRAFDMRGAPANPFSVGHVVLDLIQAFAAYYEAYDGIPAPIAETIIINSIGEHLAHAHGLHEEPPLPGEDKEKELRAQIVRERAPAVTDPELGGKPTKKRLH